MLLEFLVFLSHGGVFHHIDTVHGFYLFLEVKTLVKGNVRDHDLRRTEGDELVIHQLQALLCLGVVAEIGLDVILDRHPVAGKKTEDQRYDVDQEKQHPLVYNESGDLQHRAGAFFRLFHFSSSIRPHRWCELYHISGTNV